MVTSHSMLMKSSERLSDAILLKQTEYLSEEGFAEADGAPS